MEISRSTVQIRLPSVVVFCKKMEKPRQVYGKARAQGILKLKGDWLSCPWKWAEDRNAEVDQGRPQRHYQEPQVRLKEAPSPSTPANC